MTKQMVLRKILRRRGYLVLAQANFHPTWYVGGVVSCAGGEGFNLGRPLKVVAQTTARDFLAQQRLSRRLDRRHWVGTSAIQQLRQYEEAGAPLKFWRVKRATSKQMAGQGPGMV